MSLADIMRHPAEIETEEEKKEQMSQEIHDLATWVSKRLTGCLGAGQWSRKEKKKSVPYRRQRRLKPQAHHVETQLWMAWPHDCVGSGVMNRVENGRHPRSFGRGSLQVPELRVLPNSYQQPGRVRWPRDFLRRAFAPHLLVSLDSLSPPPLSDACLEMRRYLRDVLALTHHAASHLIAVRIDC
jgi:hypothetical protein